MTEHVLWQEQIDPPSKGDVTPPRSADVVVIGAGYGGLAAARTLAVAGLSVAVVEARRLGWGAHARNGGMVLSELKLGPGVLERRYGDLGRRMYADANEAFDAVESMVRDEGLDCDYERCGELYLAHAERLVPRLRRLADEHLARGEAVRFVVGSELPAEIGSNAFPAGIVFDRAGSLHPAKFHAALAARARHAGALVIDECLATSVRRSGSRFVVDTAKGPIDAGVVIVATNAYADGLIPALRRRILPVGSYIVTTEPLDPGLADELSPRRRNFIDTKQFLFYWRLTPDRRMLFGGRRSLAASSLADATDYVAASMRRIHPQLGAVDITHRWGGSVAITLDRLPHVGRFDGVWYAAGCNGSGVALNTWLGDRLARHVLGDVDLPSFAELRHRPIPLHRTRRWWLPIVGQWFRWKDRP